MKNILILLAFAVLISGCRKDTDEVNTTNTTTGFEPTAVYVNGTIAGQVVNESGSILAGVPVRLGDHSATTSDDGYFIFRNVPLNTRGAYVYVDHPGHWHASRRVVPHHNATHYTTLTLMPKQHGGDVNASEGGTVELPGGIVLTFEPNSFENSAGELFHGTVTLATRWMDPVQHETQSMMPGTFHGISADNKEVALKNYGIAGVELMSSSGDPLRIVEGVEASLSFPVPPQLEGIAPASLALWHFDESSGYWREEGNAVKNGNMYTGQVSHFSFWSVNESFDTVLLEGTLVNEEGEALANTQVSVLFPEQNSAATGYTNANGIFSGLVPSGEELVLMVSDDCNFSVYAQNIPPLLEDTDLGTIAVSTNEISSTTISGVLTNCDGDIVNQAIVQICWPQGCQFILPNADGSFEQTFTWCGASEFNIGIVDYSTGETFSATESAEAEIALGNVQVCEGPLETYISLDFNGTERFYPFPIQFIQFDYVRLNAEDSGYWLRLSIPEAATGTYSNADISFSYYDATVDPDIPLFTYAGNCYFGECENLSIIITAYGDVGGFIEGTYSGNVDFTSNTEYFPNAPISGSFRIVRSI